MVFVTDEQTRAESSIEEGEASDVSEDEQPPLPDEQPPLPDEQPPLPDEQPPTTEAQSQSRSTEDDGWEARFDPNTQAYYFFNRHTGVSQWENPRLPAVTSIAAPTKPSVTSASAPGTNNESTQTALREPYMGYNPKIHGDFDPNADYAQFHKSAEETIMEAADEPNHQNAAAVHPLAQTGLFNRFTGKFQGADTPDANYHNDENKSARQMNAFFDVESAASAHDGRSLKAERVNQKLSKKEIKAFNDRRRERKEKKRRAFLTS